MNLHDLDVPEEASLNASLTIGDLEVVFREFRQEGDGYWAYTTRVTNLDLPRGIDGVFLDTET